jgi:hypothetical protein
MRNVDEFIQKNVETSFQPQMYEIAEELWDLLVVLDKKDYVRKDLFQNNEKKLQIFRSVGKNCDRILSAHNKFFELFIDEGKRKKFLDFMREFEFTDPDLGHIFIVQLIYDFLLVSESFKNILIFVLGVKPKTTLGQLFKKLERITKDTGEAKKIAERIDIDLRNSLAHFTFKASEETIYYYNHENENGKWILKEMEIKPYELIEKIQNQSIIRGILFSVILDWYGLA